MERRKISRRTGQSRVRPTSDMQGRGVAFKTCPQEESGQCWWSYDDLMKLDNKLVAQNSDPEQVPIKCTAVKSLHNLACLCIDEVKEGNPLEDKNISSIFMTLANYAWNSFDWEEMVRKSDAGQSIDNINNKIDEVLGKNGKLFRDISYSVNDSFGQKLQRNDKFKTILFEKIHSFLEQAQKIIRPTIAFLPTEERMVNLIEGKESHQMPSKQIKELKKVLSYNRYLIRLLGVYQHSSKAERDEAFPLLSKDLIKRGKELKGNVKQDSFYDSMKMMRPAMQHYAASEILPEMTDKSDFMAIYRFLATLNEVLEESWHFSKEEQEKVEFKKAVRHTFNFNENTLGKKLIAGQSISGKESIVRDSVTQNEALFQRYMQHLMLMFGKDGPCISPEITEAAERLSEESQQAFLDELHALKKEEDDDLTKIVKTVQQQTVQQQIIPEEQETETSEDIETPPKIEDPRINKTEETLAQIKNFFQQHKCLDKNWPCPKDPMTKTSIGDIYMPGGFLLAHVMKRNHLPELVGENIAMALKDAIAASKEANKKLTLVQDISKQRPQLEAQIPSLKSQKQAASTKEERFRKQSICKLMQVLWKVFSNPKTSVEISDGYTMPDGQWCPKPALLLTSPDGICVALGCRSLEQDMPQWCGLSCYKLDAEHSTKKGESVTLGELVPRASKDKGTTALTNSFEIFANMTDADIEKLSNENL